MITTQMIVGQAKSAVGIVRKTNKTAYTYYHLDDHFMMTIQGRAPPVAKGDLLMLATTTKDDFEMAVQNITDGIKNQPLEITDGKQTPAEYSATRNNRKKYLMKIFPERRAQHNRIQSEAQKRRLADPAKRAQHNQRQADYQRRIDNDPVKKELFLTKKADYRERKRAEKNGGA